MKFIIVVLAALSVLCFGTALGYGSSGDYTEAARMLFSSAAMAVVAMVFNTRR